MLPTQYVHACTFINNTRQYLTTLSTRLCVQTQQRELLYCNSKHYFTNQLCNAIVGSGGIIYTYIELVEHGTCRGGGGCTHFFKWLALSLSGQFANGVSLIRRTSNTTKQGCAPVRRHTYSVRKHKLYLHTCADTHTHTHTRVDICASKKQKTHTAHGICFSCSHQGRTLDIIQG